MPECYVYVYEFAGVVRYVGEGRGNRIQHHVKHAAKLLESIQRGEEPKMTRFYRNYVAALVDGVVPTYRKIAEGLTKHEAVARQDVEIALYSREQIWNSVYSTHPWVTDEAVRIKQSAAIRAALAHPVVKEKLSLAQKNLWSDPDTKIKRCKVAKIIWSSPAARARLSATSKAVWAVDPIRNFNRISAIKTTWSSPAVRSKSSELRKAEWADPLIRAKHLAARSDPIAKNKHSAAVKAAWIRRKTRQANAS